MTFLSVSEHGHRCQLGESSDGTYLAGDVNVGYPSRPHTSAVAATTRHDSSSTYEFHR